MPDAVEAIKKAAMDAVKESKPVDIVFGQVTSASPLEITVEQKIVLTAPMLILTRNVKDFDVPVTVHWATKQSLTESHSHSIGSEATPLVTKEGGDPVHIHDVTPARTGGKTLGHNHDIEGRKVMTVHNALLAGEYVFMLRLIGGQQYIVVDRVI